MFKEIAHELKSPIAIMQARLSLLMEDNLEKDTLPKYIDETNEDIEDIKRLIYELLFLEEIELDMQNTLKSHISMKGICEIMQNKFQPLLKLNNIQINADWSQDFSIYSFEHSILKVMQAIYENIAVHAKKDSIITMKVNVDKKSMTITNLYQENEDGHFHSTNIGTKIIQRLSSKLNFSVETTRNKAKYITIITFHS
jgi:signal transduction histidine kinase